MVKGVGEKKTKRRGRYFRTFFFLKYTTDTWQMVGFGGSKKENSNSANFQDQEGSLTTSSSLYSSSLVIRLKGRMKEKKTQEWNQKVQLVEPILSFFFSNTIPSPHRRSLDPLLPPFFYFDTAFARSHPIATLKITCVIFFLFYFCV
jgi:hypothetical protein